MDEAHSVQLTDGRSLCYAQYGDPDGFTVVNAHGGLACRLDVASADAAAREHGVRLISPDRPGIGGSDAQAGRTILGWANDVAELLDLLGADRFGVMGWSMGGQYAAAVGRALAPRVSRVAIIAGVPPLTEPGAFAQLPTFDRVYTRLSQRAPWLARICFRATWLAQDQLVGKEWLRELARRIPGATLHLRPGGHFLAHLYYGEIFEGLKRG